MIRPNREPDFRSGNGSTSMNFWFEPEMAMMITYSPFNIVINENSYLSRPKIRIFSQRLIFS